MTDCKFYIRDSKLTTISGADAGSYMVNDNYANIKVGGVTYRRSPYDMTISKIDTKQQITITVV